jgi:hypothetical protein
MLVDLDFLARHWFQVALLVVAVFPTNTFGNTLIRRMLGEGWSESLYAGTLLSQIGEFGFVLSVVGYRSRLITSYGYQLTITTIAITLILSPSWIALMRRVIRARKPGRIRVQPRSPPGAQELPATARRRRQRTCRPGCKRNLWRDKQNLLVPGGETQYIRIFLNT